MENFKHFNVEPSRCMLQAIQKSVSIFSFSWKAVFVRIIQFNVIDSMNFTSHDNKLVSKDYQKNRESLLRSYHYIQ